MPFAMLRNLRKSPLAMERWDGVVWYAPSIFHGPLVSSLKKSSACKSYLIIRDIFPEWAVDMGLMGRGLPYRFFDAVARYQYSVADVIGVQTRQLDNVVFFDEIDPDEIPDLYAQCHAGIVALDPRHKSHNIPGKFLTYMQSGLPVLANINEGNDLAELIRQEGVGQVCETHQVGELLRLADKLLDQIETDPRLSARCTALFQRGFAVENTVKQIVAALSPAEAGRP